MSYKKSPNFTELEKEVLTDILRTDGRRDIIEDKRNNGKMILIKENAWDEVVRLFNASHGVNSRTKKQLKDAWKNMKSRTKAKFAEMKRDTRATGGGSAQATGFDAISEKVMGMVPEQIHSLRNPFDDDAVYHEEQVNYILMSPPPICPSSSTTPHMQFICLAYAIHMQKKCICITYAKQCCYFIFMQLICI